MVKTGYGVDYKDSNSAPTIYKFCKLGKIFNLSVFVPLLNEHNSSNIIVVK